MPSNVTSLNGDDICIGSWDYGGRDQLLTILFAINELHMRRGSTFERGLRGVVVNALKRTRSSRLSTDLLGWRRNKKRQLSNEKE